jgi:hypothetical protein
MRFSIDVRRGARSGIVMRDDVMESLDWIRKAADGSRRYQSQEHRGGAILQIGRSGE